MKPLFVLLIAFSISVMVIRIGWHRNNTGLAGCIGLSVMLLFTSLGHFIFTNGMMLMVPAFIPFKRTLVYVTGLFEMTAAAGLLLPGARTITGWLLIIFFLVLLPANINAAMKHIDHEKGNTQGRGLSYLWFRIPLQIFFIAWTYLFTIFF